MWDKYSLYERRKGLLCSKELGYSSLNETKLYSDVSNLRCNPAAVLTWRDANYGAKLNYLTDPIAPFDCCFSSEYGSSHILYGGDDEGRIVVIDTRHKFPDAVVGEIHNENLKLSIYGMAMSQSSNVMVATYCGCKVASFDVTKHSVIHIYKTEHYCNRVRFSPEHDNKFYCCGMKSSVLCFDGRMKSYHSYFIPKYQENSQAISTLNIQPVGLNFIVTGLSYSEGIAIWDTRQLKAGFPPVSSFNFPSQPKNALCCDLKSDGMNLFASFTNKKIYRFNIAEFINEKCTSRDTRSTVYEHSSHSFDFSTLLDVRDGLLTSGSSQNCVVVWDIDNATSPLATLSFMHDDNWKDINAFGGFICPTERRIVACGPQPFQIWSPDPNSSSESSMRPHFYFELEKYIKQKRADKLSQLSNIYVPFYSQNMVHTNEVSVFSSELASPTPLNQPILSVSRLSNTLYRSIDCSTSITQKKNFRANLYTYLIFNFFNKIKVDLLPWRVYILNSEQTTLYDRSNNVPKNAVDASQFLKDIKITADVPQDALSEIYFFKQDSNSQFSKFVTKRDWVTFMTSKENFYSCSKRRQARKRKRSSDTNISNHLHCIAVEFLKETALVYIPEVPQ